MCGGKITLLVLKCKEPWQPSRYSDWLRAERLGRGCSSPDRDNNGMFMTASRLSLGPTQPPI